jgi:hypothetical protein
MVVTLGSCLDTTIFSVPLSKILRGGEEGP